LRNVGSEIAVNITVEPFSIGDTLITCDVIDRLLPNGDTARLTSEMRREDDVRKPCLVGLDQLFQFELLPKRQSEQPPTPISLGFEDLIGRRYRISYLARYQQGINECKLEYKALARMN